jgi:cobalt-zinc-cadmium efflux system membrane fusion protein
VAAFPDERFRGRVAYLSSQMNRETRTLKARIDVANPGERLRPQMFAKAEIAGPASTETLAVPAEAVVLLQGQPHVFVSKDGGFEPRPVETGLAGNGLTALRRGVQPGETVVVSGAYALKAKMLKSQISDTH